MSVTSTTNRQPYTGNGIQTVFPYTFKIFANTDLQVFVAGVMKTLTTDYTVSGVGNPGGGDVTLLSAPPNGATVLIIRILPQTQEVVYPSNDKFPAKVHENALDKATMLIQQLSEVDNRSLKLPVTSGYQNLTVPDPVDGKLLGWKSDLSGLENKDVVPLGSLTLPVPVANGGTGATSVLAARQSLGLDGQVVRQFTNRTGGSLAAGDVVAMSTANDDSVVLENTQGSKRIYVVALAAISNLAVGDFLVRGVADVAMQGAVAVGAYVRKSATSLKAESTGTTQDAATDPPATALGVTIGAVSGGKARTIWSGMAFPSAAASTVPRGVIAGLTIANNAGDATNDIDIAAGEAASDDTVAANRVWLTGTAMTKQLDVAWAAGTNAGGRISAEALADGTWHLYLFKRSGGAFDYCYSQSLTPALPDGGTSKRRIASVVRAAGALKAFHQIEDDFYWDSPVLDRASANVAATTQQTQTLTVPTGLVLRAKTTWIMNGSNMMVYVAQPGVSDLAPSATASPGHLIGAAAARDANPYDVWVSTSAQCKYRASATTIPLAILTVGWTDTRGRNA